MSNLKHMPLAAEAEVARLSTTPDDVEVAELVDALCVKSAMIKMGEKIAWGSDTALMDKAADALTRLSHALAALRAKLAEVERERDELQAAIDSIETSHGLTDNGNLWRFWSKLASDYGHELASVKADRDEERKLANDLAYSLKAANHYLRVAGYTPYTEATDRHAARRKTPADAQAAITAIERAAYERGVRDAAAQVADTCPHADVPGGNCTPDTFDEGTSAAYEAILALLTQEGR